MKSRKLWLPLVLAAALLCGCGGTGGDGETLFGRSIFYTRAATDAEAFSHILDREDDEDVILEDDAVPLAGLPAEAEEEGWLLVRYTRSEDGTAEPQWYRVWTGEDGWSSESLPCGDSGWRPVIPGEQ